MASDLMRNSILAHEIDWSGLNVNWIAKSSLLRIVNCWFRSSFVYTTKSDGLISTSSRLESSLAKSNRRYLVKQHNSSISRCSRTRLGTKTSDNLESLRVNLIWLELIETQKHLPGIRGTGMSGYRQAHNHSKPSCCRYEHLEAFIEPNYLENLLQANWKKKTFRLIGFQFA